MRRRELLRLAAGAAAALGDTAAAQAAPRCGTNNGGCVPGTRCFEVAGRKLLRKQSHPMHGKLDIPGKAF